MKCANCQMLNQIPEAPCSHCGRMMPALKPVFTRAKDDEAETDAEGETGAEGEKAPAEAAAAEVKTEAGETAVPADEGGGGSAIFSESGHVDNVGDPSETPVP